MTPRHVFPALALAMTALSSPAPAADWPDFKPPVARLGDTVETLHGTKVADPYRWLESTETDEAKAWIGGQAAAARKFLDALPAREPFRKRLAALWDYDKHGLPSKHGDRLFYSRKTGLQNQGVHYWRPDAEGAAEKVLLDANTLSADGTVAVSDVSVSEDGKYFAYSTSASGSDWEEWKIIEVATGKTLPETLKWVKFSGGSWSADGRGFYYNRYAEPKAGEEFKAENLNQKVYFHVVGTPQERDVLVHERPDQPKWMFGVGETEDGQFRIMDVTQGAASKNSVWIAARKDGGFEPFRPLMEGFEARYSFVGHEGGTLYFFTDKEAPRGRLIAVDASDPAPAKWRTVIPESKATIQSVSFLSGRFIVQVLADAHDEVRIHEKDGKPAGEVKLPDLGAVGGFGGRQDDRVTYYSVTGYTLPSAIFRYDVTTGQSTPWWQAKVDFDPAAYHTEQVFYPSKDGTRVPMFLVHRKDRPANEPRPTVLYGYGGFNISMGPGFSPSLIAWLEKGGVYAVACLRGGGEYGEEWHSAGQKLKKQNVFDDFISAAEWLVREKWTTPAQLGIHGGSNGGLLVGACLVQRPDLFGAAVPAVGVHDLLRFQKFTIGWAWQEEYGFPEKDAADFKNLLKLSPVHNVKSGTAFPPVMVETADHDDRVFPAHSFKFGAALQAAQAGKSPVVLRIETKAGHGAGTPTSKMIDSAADRWAFFAQALGMKLE